MLGSLLAQEEPTSGLSGLSGWVADVIAALGAWGVGALTFLETVFPPIPSEVVLPLSGFLAARGVMDLWWVLAAATIGSVLGAAVLYEGGRRLGEDRAQALLCRLPLVEGRDVERSSQWFARHGPYAVLFGRMVPGVRSLISIPAGAQAMPRLRFLALTLVGSLAWNSLLVLGGAALGSQWQRVEQYSDVLDLVLIGGLVLLVAVFVVRRLRTRRRRRARGQGAEHAEAPGR